MLKRFSLAALMLCLIAWVLPSALAQNNVVVCAQLATGGCAPLPTAPTFSGVTVGVAHAQALAAGSAATYLLLANPSAAGGNTIYCSFGGTAVLNAAGTVPIAPGQINTWEGNGVPTVAIDCIATGATTPLTIGVK